jgi:hypothetical protein
MARADWRSASAYEDLRPLDAPGFAFEFLRRNPDFLKDHARLARKNSERQLDSPEAEAFAQRWGVHFRTRITYASTRSRAMDTQDAPERRHPDNDDGRAGRS